MTRTAALKPKPSTVRWVAFRDGVAHAQATLPTPATRALCGAALQPLRYAWPERTRCPLCAALATGEAA